MLKYNHLPYASCDFSSAAVVDMHTANLQSIATCGAFDLLKSMSFKTHNYYDGFILKAAT